MTRPLQKCDETTEIPKRSWTADRMWYMNVSKPLPEPDSSHDTEKQNRKEVKRPVEIEAGEASPELKRLAIKELIKQD